jgi:hypothetical protein
VRHRLAVAGGSPDLFSIGALALLHEASGGVPRLVNQLCDTALVYGFAAQQPGIDAGLMHEVIAARRVGGVLPVQHGSADTDTAKMHIQPGAFAAAP